MSFVRYVLRSFVLYVRYVVLAGCLYFVSSFVLQFVI